MAVVGHEAVAGQQAQQLEVVVTGEHFNRVEREGVDGFDGARPDGGKRNDRVTGNDDGITPPGSTPVRQYDACNGPPFVDPKELVDRVRTSWRAPPPLQISGFPSPRFRIREASALQELRRENQVLEARGPHLTDRHAPIL